MNLKSKIQIDQYLGTPVLIIVFLIESLKKSIITKFNKKHLSSISVPEKILICKYQGLGSLAMAAPAIYELKNKYPNSKIYFLGTSATAPLAQLMNEFEEVVVLKDNNIFSALISFIKIWFYFKKLKLDIIVDLEFYSNLAALISYSLGAKKNFGFFGDFSQKRSVLYFRSIKFNRHIYVGTNYWRLFLEAFSHIQKKDVHYLYRGWKISFSNKWKAQLGRYLVLNIQASSLSLERKWPIENFQVWAKDFLLTHPEMKIVLIGIGKSEIEEAAKFFKHARIINLSGLLSTQNFIELIKDSERVVTNDSAPLHLAQLFKVPTVALFGPTLSNNFVIPNNNQVSILQNYIECSPCVHHWQKPPCGGNNICMKSISPNQLIQLTTLARESNFSLST